MTKVTCNGLGTGEPPYAREVPTQDLYPNMTIQGVQITISLEAYTRLVNWASMGRTLGGVLEVLCDASVSDSSIADKANDAFYELEDVKAALDECHQAVRRHWATMKVTP
jgi:hypothetical protein